MLFTLYTLRSNLVYKMWELITIRDTKFWLNWRNITFIYFSFFQLMARNMLLVWNAQSRNAVQRLLDQAMLVCTFAARLNVKMNQIDLDTWTQLLDLLHFWIILIEPIFLFYAHIWIKYLRTTNQTHSYTNLLSTICFENLDV